MRRVFGDGEDPFTWSFPIGRWLGIQARMHVVIPLWMSAEIIASMGVGAGYTVHAASATAAFVLIGLARELVKARLARALGSDVDHIVVWPLGGLGPVARAGLERPMLAESGGLLAGLVLWPLLCLLAWCSGVPWTHLGINPLGPVFSPAHEFLDSPLKVAVWWLYYANLIQLVVNLFLPVLPLDGGRVVFALVASFRGRARAAEVLGRVGGLTGLGLLVVGATADQPRLIATGVIMLLATVLEVRRVQFEVEAGCPKEPEAGHAAQSGGARAGYQGCGDGTPASAPTLDELQEKISRVGLAGLSGSERRVLRDETERRRGC